MARKIQLMTENEMAQINTKIEEMKVENDQKYVKKSDVESQDNSLEDRFDEIDRKLNTKLSLGDSNLSDHYFTKHEIQNNYYDIHAIRNMLLEKLDISQAEYFNTENYYTKQAVDNLLLSKIDTAYSFSKEEMNEKLGKLVNSESLNETLNEMNTRINSKLDSSLAGGINNENYYPKSELYNREEITNLLKPINDNKADKETIAESIKSLELKIDSKLSKEDGRSIDNSNYYDKATIDEKVAELLARVNSSIPENQVTEIFRNYATNDNVNNQIKSLKTNLEERMASFKTLDNNNYYMKSHIDSNYYTNETLNNLLERKVNTTDLNSRFIELNERLSRMDIRINSKFDASRAGTIDNTNFYTKQETYNREQLDPILNGKANSSTLENYYFPKSETFSKQEVLKLLNKKLDNTVLDELNIKINSKFDAALASTIDNSNFYTKQETYTNKQIDRLLAKTLKDTDLIEINKKLAGKMDETAVVNIENFYNKEQINEMLRGKISNRDIDTKFEEYYNKEEIENKLRSFTPNSQDDNSFMIGDQKYKSKIIIEDNVPYLVTTAISSN